MSLPQKFFIMTYGCAQNQSDSERVKAYYQDLGYKEVLTWKRADLVVVNTCIVRESAENRAFGLINNIDIYRKEKKKKIKIVVTGCLPGVAHHVIDKKTRAKKIADLYKRFPQVDEFLPIAKISYDLDPVRDKKKAGLVTISTGCNNFCSFCIVPAARGREVSRKMEDILAEVDRLIAQGFEEVVLIGQNVNSYGSDLVAKGKEFVVVKQLGRPRIPTMFPLLLEKVAQKKLKKVSFVSSNPWDFSEELIEVIAKYPNIDRKIHLPLQSGDDEILKKMKRSYTVAQYLDLIKKIRAKVEGVSFTTDIIIGFCGETKEQFENTVKACQEVGFVMTYINKYSPRVGTVSAKLYPDDVPSTEKRRRWLQADVEINHYVH